MDLRRLPSDRDGTTYYTSYCRRLILQVGSDGLAEYSNFFTGGHGTDSVSTGLDGEAGPGGQDVWGGKIHLEVL